MRAIPMTIPPTIPTVARPTARSAPSLKPRSSMTPRIPAAVPCPPSKAISIRAPVMGEAAKTGTSTRAARSRPTTYWPEPSATPRESWGPASCTARLGVGSSWPRNMVAKMTLISRPGRAPQVVSMASVKRPLSPQGPENRPSTWGPSRSSRTPATMELGRKRVCTQPTLTRMILPMRRATPRMRRAKPTACGDMVLPLFSLVRPCTCNHRDCNTTYF